MDLFGTYLYTAAHSRTQPHTAAHSRTQPHTAAHSRIPGIRDTTAFTVG